MGCALCTNTDMHCTKALEFGQETVTCEPCPEQQTSDQPHPNKETPEQELEGLVVKEKTDDHFYGTYKDHEIQIDRDKERYDDFYILVWSDEGYGYDGWWEDSATATIDDAVKEAINGAML